jgi:hypothetical protein
MQPHKKKEILEFFEDEEPVPLNDEEFKDMVERIEAGSPGDLSYDLGYEEEGDVPEQAYVDFGNILDEMPDEEFMNYFEEYRRNINANDRIRDLTTAAMVQEQFPIPFEAPDLIEEEEKNEEAHTEILPDLPEAVQEPLGENFLYQEIMREKENDQRPLLFRHAYQQLFHDYIPELRDTVVIHGDIEQRLNFNAAWFGTPEAGNLRRCAVALQLLFWYELFQNPGGVNMSMYKDDTLPVNWHGQVTYSKWLDVMSRGENIEANPLLQALHYLEPGTAIFVAALMRDHGSGFSNAQVDDFTSIPGPLHPRFTPTNENLHPTAFNTLNPAIGEQFIFAAEMLALFKTSVIPINEAAIFTLFKKPFIQIRQEPTRNEQDDSVMHIVHMAPYKFIEIRNDDDMTIADTAHTHNFMNFILRWFDSLVIGMDFDAQGHAIQNMDLDIRILLRTAPLMDEHGSYVAARYLNVKIRINAFDFGRGRNDFAILVLQRYRDKIMEIWMENEERYEDPDPENIDDIEQQLPDMAMNERDHYTVNTVNIFMRPTHDERMDQFNWKNYTENKAAWVQGLAVFCKSSLGSLRELACFSSVTERICLFEAYCHMLLFDVFNEKYKGMNLEKKKNYIYKLFLAVPNELKEICISGSIYRFMQYMEANHPNIGINYYFYERCQFPENYSADKKFTIVLKDGHAIVCFTRKLDKEVFRRFKSTVSLNKNSTSGRYVLKPKKPFIRKSENEQHYAWDIETAKNDKGECIPYCIVIVNIYDMKERYIFLEIGKCKEEFIAWIQKRADVDSRSQKGGTHARAEKKIYLWGFNSHRFDLMPFVAEFVKRFSSTSLIGNMSKVRKLTIGANIEFIDFYACAPCGTLDEMIQDWLPETEHKKGEVPHELITPETYKQYLPDVIPYCENDCVILGELVKKWITSCDELKVKPYVMSCSQYALSVFRTHFLKVPINGLEYQDCQRIRQSYFGGINWILRKEVPIDETEGFVYDFNSSYPRQMMELLPISHFKYTTKIQKFTSSNYKELIDEKNLYQVVTWKWINAWPYPFFMTRHPTEGSIEYIHERTKGAPCGIWGNTLKLAFENNLIDGEITSYGYDEFTYAYIFKEFIEDRYGKRLAAKELKQNFLIALYKLQMNNLYGKFAQEIQKIIEWMGLEEFQYKVGVYNGTNYVESVDQPLPGVYEIKYDNYQYAQNVGGLCFVASKITALARDAIMKALMVVVAMGGEASYIDTDSIHTNIKLPDESIWYKTLGCQEPFIHESVLGGLKLEYAYKRAIWCTKKVYLLDKGPEYLEGVKWKEAYDEWKKGGRRGKPPVNRWIKRLKGVPSKVIKDETAWETYNTLLKDKKIEMHIPVVFFRKAGKVEIRSITKVIRIQDKRNFIDSFISLPIQ